jgi:5-methylcytosine-specific restriction protein A
MPAQGVVVVASVPPAFIVGEVYRRRSLHEGYGGQQQGGISTPADFPVIFLFTGESGRQYGYQDGYDEGSGLFLFSGEGQTGPMQFIRGNRAIADHEKNGKVLHLFRTASRGSVEYVGRATYMGHRWKAGADRNSTPRETILFELSVDADLSGVPITLESSGPAGLTKRLWAQPLQDLRALALRLVPAKATLEERKRNVYQRSEAVKVYVLRRSQGACEGCQRAAPFKRPDGSYYLEPHHIRRLADSGPDHPRWVAALCPNCHRRVHSADDGTSYNQLIADRIGQLES